MTKFFFLVLLSNLVTTVNPGSLLLIENVGQDTQFQRFFSRAKTFSQNSELSNLLDIFVCSSDSSLLQEQRLNLHHFMVRSPNILMFACVLKLTTSPQCIVDTEFCFNKLLLAFLKLLVYLIYTKFYKTYLQHSTASSYHHSQQAAVKPTCS